MDGNAVFTTEMSSTTRICAVRATARTAHDLRGPSSSVGGCAACGSAAVTVADGVGGGADSVRLTKSSRLGRRRRTRYGTRAPQLIGNDPRLVRPGSVRAGTMAGLAPAGGAPLA